MKKHTKLTKISFLGYILILAGLLFITIPLGKRSLNDLSYDKRLEEFEKKESQRDQNEIAKEDEAAAKYNDLVRNSDTSILDPFTTDENKNTYNYFKNSDEVFAYLVIPKLGKNLPIYLDASLYHISIGVAQVEGTSIPVGGKGTRSVIAGHRDWWGDDMFLFIDELVEGDDVYVKRAGKTLHYKVSDKEVIGPYDRDRLEKRENEDILTLLTCHPFYPPRPDRLLVNCVRYDTEGNETAKDNEPTEKIEEAKGAKTAKNIYLIGSILGALCFILVLIRLIKRIKYSRENM